MLRGRIKAENSAMVPLNLNLTDAHVHHYCYSRDLLYYLRLLAREEYECILSALASLYKRMRRSSRLLECALSLLLAITTCQIFASLVLGL